MPELGEPQWLYATAAEREAWREKQRRQTLSPAPGPGPVTPLPPGVGRPPSAAPEALRAASATHLQDPREDAIRALATETLSQMPPEVSEFLGHREYGLALEALALAVAKPGTPGAPEVAEGVRDEPGAIAAVAAAIAACNVIGGEEMARAALAGLGRAGFVVVPREALSRAYDAGFAASGEGWNGEYPGDAQHHDLYRHKRAEALVSLGAASRDNSPTGKA